MTYEIEFTPQALDDISNLDKTIAERVIKRLDWGGREGEYGACTRKRE